MSWHYYLFFQSSYHGVYPVGRFTRSSQQQQRQVVSVHPQSFHDTAVPMAASTLLLFGLFSKQNDQPSSQRGEPTDIERSPPVSFDDQALAEVDTQNIPLVNRAASSAMKGMEGLENEYNPTAATAKHMKTVVLPRPEFRYRVPLEDASLDTKISSHHIKSQCGISEYSNQVLYIVHFFLGMYL